MTGSAGVASTGACDSAISTLDAAAVGCPGCRSLDDGRPVTATLVLNWNGLDDTLACLASLEALAYRRNHVIVVDNGSRDGSPDAIASARPGIHQVRLPENLGFAAAMNAGAADAADLGASLLWFLNNDTRVDPQALTALVETIERDPGVGLVGSVVHHWEGGHVQAWGGGRLNPWLGTATLARAALDRAPDHVYGASMLARADAFAAVHGFDTAYFFYLEDTDLSVRLRRRGWRLSVAAGSHVWHRGGASVNGGERLRSRAADRHHARSTGLFVATSPAVHARIAVPLRLAAMLVRRRESPPRAIAAARAYLEGVAVGRSLRRRGGPMDVSRRETPRA